MADALIAFNRCDIFILNSFVASNTSYRKVIRILNGTFIWQRYFNGDNDDGGGGDGDSIAHWSVGSFHF